MSSRLEKQGFEIAAISRIEVWENDQHLVVRGKIGSSYVTLPGSLTIESLATLMQDAYGEPQSIEEQLQELGQDTQ